MQSGNMPKSLYQNWQFAIEVNGFDLPASRPRAGLPQAGVNAVTGQLPDEYMRTTSGRIPDSP